MSIDTLKLKNGTYRNARNIDIERALNCGHTEHLQTERGIVALRPYTIEEVRINKRTGERYFPGEQVGKNWLIEYYPPNHNHGDEIRLYTNNKEDALRFAFKHLNGHTNPYQPNDSFSVYANQAERDGYVLAVIGDEVLVEYQMPGTTSKWAGHPAEPTSALRIQKVLGNRMIGDYKSVSYNNVPKKWLRAIKEAGMTDWIGMGQRSRTRIPFPTNV